MRMRKKKNADKRLESCSELLIKSRDEILNKPVHLEIGCGKGTFITEMAKRNPNINYIAIEKISDVIIHALEKVKNEGLTNVRFIIGDAKSIPEFFSKGDCERIYLNFSDPWPKAGHYKRRLTYRAFLDVYKSVLTNTGSIFIKTDNRALFDFSLDELTFSGFDIKNVTYDLHNSEFNAENIVTEYEANFSQKGFKINRLEAYMNEKTDIVFRKARMDDLDTIMTIIGQAREYMREKGINQWINGYPERELIQKEIVDGDRYVLDQNGNVLCSAGIFFGVENTYKNIYQGNWLSDGEYGAVHRIAVSKDHKGLGLAGIMMKNAEELCLKKGIHSLRIDTHEDNRSMQRMLDKNGYTNCGIIYLEDGAIRLAYEKLF